MRFLRALRSYGGGVNSSRPREDDEAEHDGARLCSHFALPAGAIPSRTGVTSIRKGHGMALSSGAEF